MPKINYKNMGIYVVHRNDELDHKKGRPAILLEDKPDKSLVWLGTTKERNYKEKPFFLNFYGKNSYFYQKCIEWIDKKYLTSSWIDSGNHRHYQLNNIEQKELIAALVNFTNQKNPYEIINNLEIKNQKLYEKNEELYENHYVLTNNNQELKEKNEELKEKNQELYEKNQKLQKKNQELKQEKEKLLKMKEFLQKEKIKLQYEKTKLEKNNEILKKENLNLTQKKLELKEKKIEINDKFIKTEKEYFLVCNEHIEEEKDLKNKLDNAEKLGFRKTDLTIEYNYKKSYFKKISKKEKILMENKEQALKEKDKLSEINKKIINKLEILKKENESLKKEKDSLIKDYER